MSDPIEGNAYFNIRTALEAIGPVKDTASGARTTCPFHKGDDPENFSLYPSGAGRCWSDCGGKTFPPAEMAAQLNVDVPKESGITVDDFVNEFSLPAYTADEFGLRDGKYNGKPCVIFPHLDENGEVLREQRRLSLYGGQRFNWKGSGGTSFIFGLHRLEQIREANFCLIVEGASDVLCAAAAGVPALGMPGAGGWNPEYLKYFGGLERVAVWREPGEAGKNFVKDIGGDIPDARVISHPVAKDPADLFRLVGADEFNKLIEDMWKNARSASQLLDDERDKELEQLLPEVGELLRDPSLVEKIQEAITAGGFVGDVKPAMVVFMTLTGRLLDRPPHLKLLGQPSSGKNAAINAALQLFPESAFLEIDAASGAYLVYSGETLTHRAVILTEMDSMPRSDTNFASFLRTLIDKGRAVYRVTVEGQKGETRKGTSVSVEGPIAFITTGIRDLDSQAHSRMLTLDIDDDPSRVKLVSKMQARRRSGDVKPVDTDRMRSLQRYLELSGPFSVIVRYWDTVIDLMPQAFFTSVRQNRDSEHLLAFIETFAVLSHAQRSRDERGRIIASIDDYERAAALLDSLFRSVSADGVTEADRDAYEAVQRLQMSHPEGVSNAMLAEELRRSRSTISTRMKRLNEKGLVKNSSIKKHEYQWSIASDLPDESGLPAAESVRDKYADRDVGNTTNIRTTSIPKTARVFDSSPPYPRPALHGTAANDVMEV